MSPAKTTTGPEVFWSYETEKCARDLPYLASKYLHIKSKEVVGFPTIVFNRAQTYLWQRALDQLRRTGKIRRIIGKSRQLGVTTVFRSLAFQQTAFLSNRNSLLITHDEPTSYELFEVEKTFKDALPDELKPVIRYESKTRLHYKQRRSISLVGHSRNLNVGAGMMFHMLHLTEAARYPNPEEVQASLFPTLSQAVGAEFSVSVIESTSRFGGEWFKLIAEAAQRGEVEYEFDFLPFFWNPSSIAPVPRDFKPTAEEREMLRRFPDLTAANLVWRRNKKAEYVTNPQMVQQEHCLTWEESWALPQGALRVFTEDALELISDCRPGTRMTPTANGLIKELNGLVEVWEEPQPGIYYDLGVDVAEGRTQAADWTVAEVVRRDTLEQVAEFRVHLDPASETFLNLVYWLGTCYNTAQINPDITGGWGAALMSELMRRNYPEIWRWRQRDDSRERVSKRLGFIYTRRDKPYLVNNAAILVQRQRVRIHSRRLKEELGTFLNIGLNEWGAAPSCYDDSVAAWMLALLSARDEWAEQWNPDEGKLKVEEPPPKTEWKSHDVEADLEAATMGSPAPYRLTPWRVR